MFEVIYIMTVLDSYLWCNTLTYVWYAHSHVKDWTYIGDVLMKMDIVNSSVFIVNYFVVILLFLYDHTDHTLKHASTITPIEIMTFSKPHTQP